MRRLLLLAPFVAGTIPSHTMPTASFFIDSILFLVLPTWGVKARKRFVAGEDSVCERYKLERCEVDVADG